ncbi:serpentine type 7TM GPCR chemoreceptor srsx domain-containing protein [Ditylenchus destructor]|nr:serpentine type 7TM GPCR chemoreceptor srsx domain-containing protein [Ditylenchus destructor]
MVVILAIIIAYDTCLTVNCIKTAFERLKDRATLMCFCFDITTRPAWLIMMTLNFSSIISYLILWIILKFKRKSKVNKRIFKALAIIMLMDILGWSQTAIVSNLSLIIKFDSEFLFYLRTSIQMVLMITTSSNAIVLFLTSKDYRQAFKTEFSFLFFRFKFRIALKSTKKLQNQNIVFVPGSDSSCPSGYITVRGSTFPISGKWYENPEEKPIDTYNAANGEQQCVWPKGGG